jgi:hypothetical protein
LLPLIDQKFNLDPSSKKKKKPAPLPSSAQMPGSYGLGAGTGSLSGMTGWGWGSYTGPSSPFSGSLSLVYCKDDGGGGGDETGPFVASRLFACTSSPGAAGGIIGDIIPRFPDGVACVNMCSHPTASGCVPCSDPGQICSREFGRGLGGALVGGGSASLGGGRGGLVGSGSIWLAEEIGRSGVMCPTPGADGGRALANTIPLI